MWTHLLMTKVELSINKCIRRGWKWKNYIVILSILASCFFSWISYFVKIESPGTTMKSKVVKQEGVSSIGNIVKNEFREGTSMEVFLDPDEDIIKNETLIENKTLTSEIVSNPGKGNPKIHVGEHCVPAASWQTTSYPTCNHVHEIDMTMQKDAIDYLGRGNHRDVWKVDHINYNASEQVALKTLRQYRDFVAKNYEMHRIDAMVAERLTFSSHVADIHGFCGQSVINEFGLGDCTRAHRIFEEKEYDSILKLHLAYGIASGIADMQVIDKDLGPTVLHLDIGESNVLISKDKRMKLNDFNGAFLLRYDEASEKMCGMKFEKRCGYTEKRADLRSPEECRGDVLSGKSDAYSIGPIIFTLLTGVRMYHYGEQEKIGSNNTMMREILSEGKVPPLLPSNIIESNDPATKELLAVMAKALTNDPDERPSAAELAKYLAKEIDRIDK